MSAAKIRTLVFFFQAEAGIRDNLGTGVQTCALPISRAAEARRRSGCAPRPRPPRGSCRRCRWTGRTGALNGCSSTARPLARAPRALLLLAGGAVCYTARHAPHEKVHQEPQQGEEAGPEAEAGPAQEKPAPRNARAVERRISGPSSRRRAAGGA